MKFSKEPDVKMGFVGLVHFIVVYLGLSPFPVIVTTRIITVLVGSPYKPSFPLLLGTTQSLPV